MVQSAQSQFHLNLLIRETFTYSLTKIIPVLLQFFAIVVFLLGWFRQALLRYYSNVSTSSDFSVIIVDNAATPKVWPLWLWIV